MARALEAVAEDHYPSGSTVNTTGTRCIARAAGSLLAAQLRGVGPFGEARRCRTSVTDTEYPPATTGLLPGPA